MRPLSAVAALLLFLTFPGLTGCHEDTQVVPAATSSQLPGQFKLPALGSGGMTAGAAKGKSYQMRFSLGGSVPPMVGSKNSINAPAASAGGSAQ